MADTRFLHVTYGFLKLEAKKVTKKDLRLKAKSNFIAMAYMKQAFRQKINLPSLGNNTLEILKRIWNQFFFLLKTFFLEG